MSTTTHYQELTIIADLEIPLHALWSKLYTQLHIAFADAKNTHGLTFGVSFPNYRHQKRGDGVFATLGYKVRVFGSLTDLQTLDLPKWLYELSDYVHIRAVASVPEHSRFVCVRRHRPSDLMEQASRFAKFKGIDLDSAILHCQMHKRGDLGYPYIELVSQSTQKPYRLHIMQTVVDSPKEGNFGSYGINNAQGEATVPHW